MNKKVFLLTIVTVIIVGGVASGYYWYSWTGSPQYTLQQIDKAIKEKKVDTALSYFDTDTIYEHMWSNMQASVAQKIIDDPNEALDAHIALQMLADLKPAYKDKTLLSLREALSSTTTTPLSILIESENGLKVDGDFAYINSSDGEITLTLKRIDGRNWKVVDLEAKNWFEDLPDADE